MFSDVCMLRWHYARSIVLDSSSGPVVTSCLMVAKMSVEEHVTDDK